MLSKFVVEKSSMLLKNVVEIEIVVEKMLSKKSRVVKNVVKKVVEKVVGNRNVVEKVVGYLGSKTLGSLCMDL